MDGRFYTLGEVAIELRASRDTVRKEIACGAIEAVRVGRRALRIPVAGLERYLVARRLAASGEATKGAH